MQIIVVAALLLGCRGLTPLEAKEKLEHDRKQAEAGRAAALDQLVTRINSGDERTIRGLFDDSVAYGGLWFPDTECQRQFAVTGRIDGDALGVFARCLMSLRMSPSARQHTYPDVGVVTYEPGIEVEILFIRNDDDDIKARFIGYAGRTGAKDALPTVTQNALEHLRIDPAPVVIDTATREEIRIERKSHGALATDVVAAWFKLCVNADGNVTSVKPRLTTSLLAQELLAASVSTWKFRPFILGGQPTPVCSLTFAGDPPDPDTKLSLPGLVPDDLGATLVVSPRVLGTLVSGERRITPTDRDKDRLKAMGGPSGRIRLYANLLFCIDETGRVDTVRVMRSSGLPGYDRRLRDGVSRWRYRPFVTRGRAVRACAHLSFAYDQRW